MKAGQLDLRFDLGSYWWNIDIGIFQDIKKLWRVESEKTRRVKQGNEGRLSLNGAAVGKWVIEGETDGKALFQMRGQPALLNAHRLSKKVMAKLFKLSSFEF